MSLPREWGGQKLVTFPENPGKNYFCQDTAKFLMCPGRWALVCEKVCAHYLAPSCAPIQVATAATQGEKKSMDRIMRLMRVTELMQGGILESTDLPEGWTPQEFLDMHA